MISGLNVSGLKQNGLVEVTYPESLRETVAGAMNSWVQFCKLTEETKKLFTYKDWRNVDGGGYELKEQKGETRDLKENFHVTPGELKRLIEIASTTNRGAEEFITKSGNLLLAVGSMVLGFAAEMEKAYSLKGLYNEVLKGQDHWILRYIHYFGDQKPGDVIAKAHADKSGFTLHLYESAPGLQYLELQTTGNTEGVRTGERQWREMPMSDGQTVIIPNMQMQYRSKGEVKALCHRVVATEESAKVGRYSAVFFVPLLNTPFYNKDGEGRLQDLSPGFNYGLPFDEFGKLFAR